MEKVHYDRSMNGNHFEYEVGPVFDNSPLAAIVKGESDLTTQMLRFTEESTSFPFPSTKFNTDHKITVEFWAYATFTSTSGTVDLVYVSRSGGNFRVSYETTWSNQKASCGPCGMSKSKAEGSVDIKEKWAHIAGAASENKIEVFVNGKSLNVNTPSCNCTIPNLTCSAI